MSGRGDVVRIPAIRGDDDLATLTHYGYYTPFERFTEILVMRMDEAANNDEVWIVVVLPPKILTDWSLEI